MGLSDELARQLPRIPHPFLPSRKSSLEVEAERVAAAFGGISREVAPRPDVIALVEARLGPDGSGMGDLKRQELKIVPYIIWGPHLRWRDDATFIRAFLSRADAVWPRAVKRLWRHYVVNFDAKTEATVHLAAWLDRRMDLLPEPLRLLTRDFDLLDVSRAASMLAVAALEGDRLIRALRDVGLSLEVFRGSALLASLLEAVGHLLASASGARRVPERLAALVGERTQNVLTEAVCSAGLRARSLRHLVDGLVAWQERMEGHGEPTEPVIGYLVALNGDPRFFPTRWHGHVSQHAVSTLEKWLSRQTIESFFRIIDALQTERPDMWRDRRAFWLSYVPFVTAAWLVVGRNAITVARKEKLPFGQFSGGAQHDHCGLMMEIGNVCIMEMNKVGSAFFWTSRDPDLPAPFESTCDRQRFIDEQKRIRSSTRFSSGRSGRFPKVEALTHQGDWQSRFRDEILKRTGIDPAARR